MNNLSTLVTELESDSVGTQLSALKQLLDLATPNNTNDRDQIATKSIKQITNLLKSSDTKVVGLSASVLRFLARTPSNKEVINSAGAVPFLIEGAESPDQIIQENSIGALWSLAPHSPTKLIIGKSGIIPKLIGLVKNAPENTKVPTVGLLYSLAVNNDFEKEIVNSGGMEAIVELLKNGGDDAKFRCCQALSNLCFTSAHKIAAVRAGAIEPLLSVLKNGPSSGWAHACTAVWNIAVNLENKTAVAKAGGIEVLAEVMGKATQDVQINAAAALATLTINHDENQETISNMNLLEPMVKHLTSKFPFTVDMCTALNNISKNVKNVEVVAKNGTEAIVKALKSETNVQNHERLTSCIRNLTVSETNKKSLPKHGVIELMISVLEGKMSNSHDEAASALWNLAIDHEIGRMIIEMGGKKVLEKVVETSSNKEAKEKARSALRALAQVSEHKPESETHKHVMISYNWSHQKLVLKIVHRLQEMGFKIWVDVEEMAGSTLEKMALAVEESSVVLVCATAKYQESQACRTEAEYTYQLKKPFIPLILDGRRPTGWLGALLGTQLFVDFSNEAAFESKIVELSKLIEKKGAETSKSVKPSSAVAAAAAAAASVEHECVKWTQREVDGWLEVYDLERFKEKFREHKISGRALDQLIQLAKKDSNEAFVWNLMKEVPVETIGERLLLRKALLELGANKYKPKKEE